MDDANKNAPLEMDSAWKVPRRLLPQSPFILISSKSFHYVLARRLGEASRRVVIIKYSRACGGFYDTFQCSLHSFSS